MMRHLAMLTIATLTALVLPFGVPLAAQGDSLLSGYGGPGAGTQAILGATLLNGSGGKGGGTQGGSGPPVGGGPGGVTSGAQVGPSERASPSASSHASSGAAASQEPHPRRPSRASQGAAAAAGGGAVAGESAGSQELGLSEGGLALVLVAVAGLALTAVLTRMMARQTGP